MVDKTKVHSMFHGHPNTKGRYNIILLLTDDVTSLIYSSYEHVNFIASDIARCPNKIGGQVSYLDTSVPIMWSN